MERTDDESNKQPVILPPMIRIAYCTPSLHIPGGVERVLTTKANYLAENGNYDIYILLTDGKGKPPCYTLSPKVKIIQLDIDFEELWELPLWKKVPVYLKKQRIYRRKLSAALSSSLSTTNLSSFFKCLTRLFIHNLAKSSLMKLLSFFSKLR